MEGHQGKSREARHVWRYPVITVLATAVALLNSVFDANAAELCFPAIALVASVQGVVELRRVGETNWLPATLNARLCPGDMIRVRERSRAALRLRNESMLRLDQRTALTLTGETQDKTMLLEMLTGALHVLTRTPKPFRIKTPFLNAGVEGTEFFIGMDQDIARLMIYEGKVSATNEHGRLMLIDSEAAIIPKDQAPQRIEMIRPMDAVHWALHYPNIIDYRFDEGTAGEQAFPALRASVELFHQGRLPEALAALDNVPSGKYSTNFLIYRAGLLLTVGRVDEARMDIGQVLELESGSSDAYALEAIIAVVQNDKEQALFLANKAVELEGTSPAAKLALSYAQQAHFEIEEALESVKKAVGFGPQNAFIWARLAELHTATGYLDRALEAAQRAVNLNPNIAKTWTVRGFVHLAQIDTGAAKVAFAAAIKLDQADPMPRLGMGLAKIREGDLEAGRVELEIAASLDPANSLIRSYLGKAYFEEKRYSLAGTQFNLAKERDPNDPTPWLYDGMMMQTQNRPVEALRDIQKSIELNDNRAVYRSQLLLDQDEAARGSSLARIYDDLGFERRAIMETAKSLSLDPSSHSAHRFLSDTYINAPRHEIARVSELLQAQLLQPINVNPVQPRLAVADLNIITGTGPAVAGFNEFTPLMERNKPQLVASGVLGSNSTLGNETVLSALYGRTSVSVGQFHYNTDGFRPNNDQKHNIYNAFIQYAVTPKFNVQAEMRTRKTEHGDLLLDFDRDGFQVNDRRKLSQDMARVGARYALSPQQDVIASFAYTSRRESLNIDPEPDFFTHNKIEDAGYQVEAQHLFRERRFNLTSGFGIYQIGVRRYDIDVYDNECLQYGACIFNKPSFSREQRNAYTYTNFRHPNNITTTLGLSFNSYKAGQADFEINKFNPKFGLQWNITANLRLRLAWFEMVKPALAVNQTLEPTQVAGFNQMYDDINGTKARRMGIGLDARGAKNVYGGVEFSERNVDVPKFTDDPFDPLVTNRKNEKQHERLYRGYIYWLPNANWAIRAEPQFEKFTRAVTSTGDEPFRIETFTGPLSFNYFDAYGIFTKLTMTYVWQNLERPSTSSLKAGTDDFFLLDTVLGYRFPNRRGILSLEGKNLLDCNFFFRNYNFQVNEAISPRFIPSRTVFLRLTLNF